MVSLILECPLDRKDELIAELWDYSTLGIREEDLPGTTARLHAFFPDEDPALAEAFAAYHPTWFHHEDRDWVETFHDAWEPTEVGRRLWLVPDWRTDPPPAGRISLPIHPGFGYGTGRHQTTRLALEAIEDHLIPGEAVLDLGCGTGILASAARLLGAGTVIACDIDPEAVTAAHQNFRADHQPIPLFIGSARSLRDAQFDLLIANINAATITHLAADLRRITRRAAIVGGFTTYDRDVLTQRLHRAGFRIEAEYQSEEWLCFFLK